MYCKNCGKPVDDGANFCKNCGTAVAAAKPEIVEDVAVTEPVSVETVVVEEPVSVETVVVEEPVNSLRDKISKIFAGKLFMVISILVSAATFFGVCVGNLDVIKILLVIFCWLAFAAAKKGKLETSHIRNISGTIYAVVVLCWVAVGLFGLIAVLSVAGSSVLSGYVPELLSSLLNYDLEFDISWAYLGGAALIAAVVIVMLVAIAAVIVMTFGWISVHKFTKSLYLGYEDGVSFPVGIKAASGWSLAFGIISGISALGSLSTPLVFLATGSVSAAWILFYIILKGAVADTSETTRVL